MKNKLTKKERHRIYGKMLEYYASDDCMDNFLVGYGYGFCGALSGIPVNVFTYFTIYKFPELMNKKPKRSWSWRGWWARDSEEGHTIRVLALLEAWEETK